MRHCGLVSAGENRRGFGRTCLMLQSHSDGWPGPARGASAHRVDDHQQSAALGKKPVNVCRSPRFFNAVLSQVGAHRGDELFGVCHDLILAATPRPFAVERYQACLAPPTTDTTTGNRVPVLICWLAEGFLPHEGCGA